MVSHKLPTLARGSWPSKAPSVLRRPGFLAREDKGPLQELRPDLSGDSERALARKMVDKSQRRWDVVIRAEDMSNCEK